MVKIRKVKAEDLKAFVEVYKSAYERMREYAYTKDKEIKRYFKWLLKRDENGFFVAEVDGRAVGFVGCDAYWHTFFDEEMGEIHEIVVLEEYRRKGIGKKLIETAEEYLKKKGYRKTGLWVGEKNHTAIKFYEKLGYKKGEKFGRWRRMEKEM